MTMLRHSMDLALTRKGVVGFPSVGTHCGPAGNSVLAYEATVRVGLAGGLDAAGFVIDNRALQTFVEEIVSADDAAALSCEEIATRLVERIYDHYRDWARRHIDVREIVVTVGGMTSPSGTIAGITARWPGRS